MDACHVKQGGGEGSSKYGKGCKVTDLQEEVDKEVILFKAKEDKMFPINHVSSSCHITSYSQW